MRLHHWGLACGALWSPVEGPFHATLRPSETGFAVADRGALAPQIRGAVPPSAHAISGDQVGIKRMTYCKNVMQINGL